MNHSSTFFHPEKSTGFHGAGPIGWLSSLYAELETVSRRIEERRHLSQLDDHLLEDMGLTREQADREAAKPFWRR